MNALVDVLKEGQADPNTRATVVELEDGIEVSSQNRWPSLRFDVRSFHGVISRLIPAGFYYKTFMWPAKFWPKYEHMIRQAAGLGRAAGSGSGPLRSSTLTAILLVVGRRACRARRCASACQAGLRDAAGRRKEPRGRDAARSNTEIGAWQAPKWATAVERELRDPATPASC